MIIVSRLTNSQNICVRVLTFQARTYAAGKEVRFGADARRVILKGAQKLARAVAVTLGPKVHIYNLTR